MVAGKFTSIPCIIMGAVTIKMIRSTSMTSTKGVTLISAMSLSFDPTPAICSPYPLKKSRSTMFRKSAEKFCISDSMTRIRWMK